MRRPSAASRDLAERVVEVPLEMKNTRVHRLALAVAARQLDADLGRLVLEEAEVGQGILQFLPASRLGRWYGSSLSPRTSRPVQLRSSAGSARNRK